MRLDIGTFFLVIFCFPFCNLVKIVLEIKCHLHEDTRDIGLGTFFLEALNAMTSMLMSNNRWSIFFKTNLVNRLF